MKPYLHLRPVKDWLARRLPFQLIFQASKNRRRYNGMIHDFGLLNGLAEEPAVRSLFDHAAAELKKYLQ
ncbi:MAG TPA: hypothetical protein VN644_09045 [Pyrinomonadaceae bacterium]|nr:hypothetical protein [Pyrinomonadaceae bacterium]